GPDSAGRDSRHALFDPCGGIRSHPLHRSRSDQNRSRVLRRDRRGQYTMTSIEYLQTAKIEELASQLRTEGYRVAIGLPGEDNGYDLVAERGRQKLAFEVKARSNLQSFAEEIGRLRKQAREQGYDFRLVVVNP